MTTNFAKLIGCSTLLWWFSICGATAHEQTLSAFVVESETVDRDVNNTQEPSHDFCKLSIRLHDARTQLPLYGLVRITDVTTGQHVPLSRALQRPMGWYSSPPQAQLSVPPGKYKIEACHGIETEILEKTLDLADRSERSVELPLHRFYDPTSGDLCSGNTHLHLILNAHRKMGVQLNSRKEADGYLQVVSKSDGLDIVYVSYLTRPHQQYITNDYTQGDLKQLSDTVVLFSNGEEYRHSGGMDSETSRVTYGHVMFLDIPRLIQPASIGPGLTLGRNATDGVPLRRGIRQIRDDGGTVVWCHGSMGTESVPNWWDGLIHAQNIYDGGNEGTIESVYYPYLNAGLKVPFSTGTDWGIWDFSRAYVPIEELISSRQFLQSLAQGRSFITNGTFLELEVAGKAPGDTVTLPRIGQVPIRARAIGHSDFVSMQLVFNGKIVREVPRRPNEGHFIAELNESLDIVEPGWIALRIPTQRSYDIRSRFQGIGTNILGKTLFAHTSPIYVTIDGREVFKSAAAKQLLDTVRASIESIRTKGVFSSAESKRDLLQIYENCALQLHERIQADRTTD